MRTFGLSLGVAAVAASLASPSLAPAQRNVRRSAPRASVASPLPSASPISPAARRCSVNCGDYSLAVVSALLPSDTAGAASDLVTFLVTLVIENRGGVSAPAAMISVAPKNHLSLARRSSIPSLSPGQRTTILLPVEIGPDGTQCISITITPVLAPDPVPAMLLAAATDEPSVDSGGSGKLGKPATWGDFSAFGDFVRFDNFGDGGD